jgi:hypothetical protein
LKRTVITIRPAALIGIGIPDRAALLVSALRLSFITIAWNGVVGTLALCCPGSGG